MYFMPLIRMATESSVSDASCNNAEISPDNSSDGVDAIRAVYIETLMKGAARFVYNVDHTSISPVDHTCISSENYKQSMFVGKVKRPTIHRQQRHHCYLRSAMATSKHDEKKLREAITGGRIDIVRDLLDEGVNPSCADNKQRSALHVAAAAGNVHIVQLLLDHGADTNQRDSIGNTPLHLAACTNNIPVVSALLTSGTDVNILDQSGHSPLHLALGRLRILRRDQKCSTDKLRRELELITDMLRRYMSLGHRCDSGMLPGQQHSDGEVDSSVAQLGYLCEQLERTTTVDDLDCVTALLTDLTQLHIEHKIRVAQ
jgi:hypothetical protein